MLGLFRRKPVSYFSEAEKAQIQAAIQEAEKATSGEIRVFIESRCRFVDPVWRARELFPKLRMHATASRNGVLVYLAMQDRQLAVYGDEGIHQKVGDAFWNASVQQMLQHFNKQNYTAGLCGIILEIGQALSMHFPYDPDTDTNELPDEIVFGK
ncbi:MAG TPA: TPM domain-containing protein [Sediminibacterium sp.]|nr:TPM domain-containing protein [Sediminibacterium sp.]